jgi:hypothetical protein
MVEEPPSLAATPPGSSLGWAVRVLALLLVAQAAGLLGIVLVEGQGIDWSVLAALPASRRALAEQMTAALALAVVLAPAALLSLLAAFGLLLRWRTGWVLGMLAQTLTLTLCLGLYVYERTIMIYPLMLISILLVFYLNTAEVRLALVRRRALPEAEARDEVPRAGADWAVRLPEAEARDER